MTNEEAEKDITFLSKKWKCSRCGEIYNFDEDVKIPAPCEVCGDIFFEKLSK